MSFFSSSIDPLLAHRFLNSWLNICVCSYMSSGIDKNERWLEFNEMIFKSREWNFHFCHTFSCLQFNMVTWLRTRKIYCYLNVVKKIFNLHFVVVFVALPLSLLYNKTQWDNLSQRKSENEHKILIKFSCEKGMKISNFEDTQNGI